MLNKRPKGKQDDEWQSESETEEATPLDWTASSVIVWNTEDALPLSSGLQEGSDHVRFV